MTVSGLAFIVIVLFMVHEFEEIIRVRRYVEKHTDDERYSKELFVAGRDHYPSTPTLAAMIYEEFILACLILIAGICLDSIEIVAATFIAYVLHLIAHIREAIVFPGWAPGSVTAVFTMPLNLLVIYAVFVVYRADFLITAILTLIIGMLLIINLRLLHRASKRIEALVTRLA